MRKYLTSDDIEKMSKMSANEISEFMKKNYPITDEEKDSLLTIHNKLTYYKIIDLNLIGKRESGLFYIYQDGEWIVDENVISDRIIGYDGESIGSSTIFDIDEITEFEALDFIEKTNG